MTTQAREVAVSVIVPVRDGRNHLARLLPALEHQSFPREAFEVIVADDGSTDGVLDGIAAEGESIRISAGPRQSSYAARNRAAAVARGAVLAFIDADCLPEPTWLAAGMSAIEGADIVAGGIRFVVPEKRTIWTLIDIETTKHQLRNVRNGVAETANLFVRRAIFDRVGGFETSTISHGDFDFVSRAVAAGARLTYCGEALAYHPTRDSARSELSFIWRAHRAYARRWTIRGLRPNALRPRYWVPVGLVRAAHRQHKLHGSWVFDEPWLAANGVVPTRRERGAAALLFYVVLPYLEGLAQLDGWIRGKRDIHRRDEGWRPGPGGSLVRATIDRAPGHDRSPGLKTRLGDHS
ncbi:MAG TPA: glycosyltransferase [Gaiellaceae bacterium]|nr:glycosyltransferase [Gaiellaceae bacterium]